MDDDWVVRVCCKKILGGSSLKALFARRANKACGVVNASGSLVLCDLRIRTERARAVNVLAADYVCREELIGSFALFHPLLEGSERVTLTVTVFAVVSVAVTVPTNAYS